MDDILKLTKEELIKLIELLEKDRLNELKKELLLLLDSID